MEDWGREWTKGKEEERENSVGLSKKKKETDRGQRGLATTLF